MGRDSHGSFRAGQTVLVRPAWWGRWRWVGGPRRTRNSVSLSPSPGQGTATDWEFGSCCHLPGWAEASEAWRWPGAHPRAEASGSISCGDVRVSPGTWGSLSAMGITFIRALFPSPWGECFQNPPGPFLRFRQPSGDGASHPTPRTQAGGWRVTLPAHHQAMPGPPGLWAHWPDCRCAGCGTTSAEQEQCTVVRGPAGGTRESRLLLLASARHMLSKYPLRAGPCLGHQAQLRTRRAQVPVLGRGLGSPEVCTPGRVWD